jgi:hypothetical protein
MLQLCQAVANTVIPLHTMPRPLHSRYSKGMLSSEKTNSHMAIWCHVCAARQGVMQSDDQSTLRQLTMLSKEPHTLWPMWAQVHGSLRTSQNDDLATTDSAHSHTHRQLVAPPDVHLVDQRQGAVRQHGSKKLEVAALAQRQRQDHVVLVLGVAPQPRGKVDGLRQGDMSA